MMPHMMEEGEVIDLDAKPPPPPPYEMTGTSESFSDACIHVLTTEGLPLRGIPADHCAVVKAQEEAWLAVLEEYKDSDVAIFGDVIVDDWPETLKKVAYSHVCMIRVWQVLLLPIYATYNIRLQCLRCVRN